jgi:hypothetical protein
MGRLMADHALRFLEFTPGIQRDGTQFNSTSCIDGEWVRFYNGKPRKMGGYKLIDPGTTEIIREIFTIDKQGSVDVYYGRSGSLMLSSFDLQGNLQDTYDRTPTDPSFVPDENNVWEFDLFSYIDGDDNPQTLLIAQVAPNGDDINNNTEGGIFYGNVDDITPLLPVTTPDNQLTSGGIAVVGDFLFKYGNNGVAYWCANGDPLDWSNANNNYVVSNTKLVQAYGTRGANTQTILFWSLNSLEKGVYSNDGDDFTFSTVQENISILSPKTVVKYAEDTFFWVGINKFYMYNGIVKTLPNNTSINFFFENLNENAREKVFSNIISTTVNEWWIHFPTGDSTECNHALVYNIDEDCWYDTPSYRSAGNTATVNLPYPLFADSRTMLDVTAPPPEGEEPYQVYGVWMHEFGYNKIANNRTYAITSYFETNLISYYAENPEDDKNIRIRHVEPDFVMNGNMTIIANKRSYPHSDIETSRDFPFDDSTPKVDMNEQAGLISLKFISNETDGFYQMGKVAVSWSPGDPRRGS